MSNILVLSFSGTGENSLTLKTLEVIEHHRDVKKFDKMLIKPTFDYEKGFDNVVDAMRKAEAIIWAVSPFHMNIQSHMLRFFEELRRRGVYLNNLNTYFTTSVHICDHILADTLEKNIRSITPYFVQGLTFAMNDIINKKMSLFTISTPDAPPKKSLFGGKPEFEEGEALKTAVQWYKIIKELAEFVKKPQPVFEPNIGRGRKVLFVDMDETIPEDRNFVGGCVNWLKEYYNKAGCLVEDLAQRDYKDVKACDGCQSCYASKECKFKNDSFPEYEKKIAEADIIIYYGVCNYGFSSSLSKKLIDRTVHNGLMPANGRLPEEMEKFQAIGYVLDAGIKIGSTQPYIDVESYSAYKSYQFALASFNFEHFLGALALVPPMSNNDLYIMAKYSLLVTREKMLPQRNFWTEKIGKHFSDLSQHIPTVLPEEAKYYKRAGGYNPVPLNTEAKTVTLETAKISAMMRQTPYDKLIQELDKRNV
ncbi:MAG: flavodoxin family protein [Clostridia bacterium]|nr:flavodoxin family protein [Clostridia bacterium]